MSELIDTYSYISIYKLVSYKYHIIITVGNYNNEIFRIYG